MIKKEKIPLFAPDFKLLRADAVWVTIANWAEGLEEQYGESVVFAGNDKFSNTEIRERCFTKNTPLNLKRPTRLRKSFFAKLLETLFKDIRWFIENRKPLNIDLSQFKNSPFIWQHHDIFQTRGLKIAKQLEIPSVLFVDAPYVWESSHWGISRFGWKHLANIWGDTHPIQMADLVLVVSEEVKRAVLNLGVDESKVLVTPCTVSTKRFDKARGLQVKDSLGLRNDTVFGWVGSFRKFHSLDLLIDSFQELTKSASKVKLLLVGDGAEKARLEEKVSKLGLINQVIFTGNIPHNEVDAYISSFDVAVLPAASDAGFHYSPLKLREFFAAGVPVIASAVGEVKAIIEQSKGGWLVPAGDKWAIAEMMKNIISSKEVVQDAGVSAKEYAETEMGISKQIDMIEEFFNLKL